LIIELNTVEEALKTIHAKGIKSLAICLLHAYTFPGKLVLFNK
jgi:N-methylhydantoinase A/oxoprolinase/acetone carboxylase beta subunit